MGRIRFKNLNIEAIIKVFILLGFAFFFFIIIQSGKAGLYVHPRIVPYIKFGIVGMLLTAFFVSRTVFMRQRRKFNVLPYLLFIIPLMSGYMMPAKALDSNSISSTNFVMGQQGEEDSGSNTDIIDRGYDIDKQVENIKNTEEVYTDEESITPIQSEAQNNIGTKKELELKENTVVIDDSNYSSWMTEIYMDTDKYVGKNIEMVGFVLKDKSLNDKQFVSARLWMSCCAADMQPVGLICEYDKVSELKSDAWVKVTGTINKMDFNGHSSPVIEAKSVEKAQKPKEEYVY